MHFCNTEPPKPSHESHRQTFAQEEDPEDCGVHKQEPDEIAKVPSPAIFAARVAVLLLEMFRDSKKVEV